MAIKSISACQVMCTDPRYHLTPEEFLLHKEELLCLHHVIASFPNTTLKKSALLCYVDKLTYAEAARELKRSHGLIRLVLKNANNKLVAKVRRIQEGASREDLACCLSFLKSGSTNDVEQSLECGTK